MMPIYDDAILRFMKQLTWLGKDIPIIFAGAERAYAQMREFLERERGVKGGSISSDSPMPYPFMAVWRDPFQEEPKMASLGLYRISLYKEEGYGLAMRRPLPMKAKCEVNIYCSDKTQWEFLEFQVRNLFRHGWSWVPVNFEDTRWYQPPNDVYQFAKVLGKQDVLFYEEGLTDNSQLENSGLQQRTLRFTLNFSIYGWLPYQPYTVPLVHKITVTTKDLPDENPVFENKVEI